MFAVTLDQDDITWLAFAAGIAAGSGNDGAARSLTGIIGRIQKIDEGGRPGEPEADYIPEPEDFDGTTDPRFVPDVAIGAPPSRPQSEFGPGPVGGTLG